ncbi:MAG: transposase [Deltaproteobacteria bacterium]|nr:transposase [Deltaproteobacteria bacterium]
MLIQDDPQNEFGDFPFSEYVIDKDHPLVKLSQAIHWKNLLEALSRFYHPTLGRPTIPLRAQAGTLMIKFIKNFSDRETVGYCSDAIPAMFFCGLHPTKVKGTMNPASGLSQFRKAIGPEGMALIQSVLEHAARGKSLTKNGQLIVDTTCVPLDIHYPTDIKLLERCRHNILKLFDEAKRLGLQPVYRTYKRMARKIFIQFSKLSKPKEKTRKKVHKQLFQFVRRNLKQLTDLRCRATHTIGKSASTSKHILQFLQNLKTTELKVRTILHQQKQIRQGFLHIPNRIVSFHKDHVRPIVRGKFPLNTEFGPKILVAVVKNCLYVVDSFHANVSDATLVLPALRWFKKTFGHLPKEILGDRGFFSRMRVQWLKALNILAGLQPRGKNVEKSSANRRMIRQRQQIEAFISLSKRKFGWNRCRAKNPDHESSWIRFSAVAASVHKRFFLSLSP